MDIIVSKDIEAADLTQAIKAAVPMLEGLGVRPGLVRVRRDGGGEFTAVEQAAIRSAIEAHDAEAIQQAASAKRAEVKAHLAAMAQAISAWDTLLPSQKIEMVKRVLRHVILTTEGVHAS